MEPASTKRAKFAQGFAGWLWKGWESTGGFQRLDGSFAILQKGRGEI
jgi:hypothetical protein